MQIWAEHFAVFLFLLDLKLCPFITTTAAEKVGASRACSLCGQHAASLCPLIPYTSKMTTRSLPYKLVDCTSRILWFLKQTFYCSLRFSKRTWNKICFFFSKKLSTRDGVWKILSSLYLIFSYCKDVTCALKIW